MESFTAFVQQKLIDTFGEQVYHFNVDFGCLNFEVTKEINLKVLRFLKEDPELNFTMLNDLTGLHNPDDKGFELSVIYHLRNLVKNELISFSVKTAIENPKIYSAVQLYSAANWMERETYDFFGIEFVGHPNLIRILNVPEMNYFPLRKEYPLEDQTRIDKDDHMFGR
ncbi:MAG: NADH-quinone oxidoreductase subunit C [Sediminibacterium sp.]|nr:NADH-quinone oxidoreductase subunit C [Sediminibacterium sp.]